MRVQTAVAAALLLAVTAAGHAQSPAPGGMPPPAGMSLAQSAALRFPQPIRVGDLPGPPAATTDRGADATRPGPIDGAMALATLWPLSNCAAGSAYAPASSAVPIDGLVLVGDAVEAVSYTPAQLWRLPIVDPTGTTDAARRRDHRGRISRTVALIEVAMAPVAMGVPLDEIAHIVQVALTPVFLLSGIASLLNVINARHGRVADQADAVALALRSGGADDNGRLGRPAERRLRGRLWALNVARACGAIAGVAICGATFALFVGALNDTAVATALFVCFGFSVLGTVMALLGFLTETVLSFRRDASTDCPAESGPP